MCKTDHWLEAAEWCRELILVLCDDLEGWDGRWGGRRLRKERIWVYLWLIHVIVPQNLTKHCKAIVLQ